MKKTNKLFVLPLTPSHSTIAAGHGPRSANVCSNNMLRANNKATIVVPSRNADTALRKLISNKWLHRSLSATPISDMQALIQVFGNRFINYFVTIG